MPSDTKPQWFRCLENLLYAGGSAGGKEALQQFLFYLFSPLVTAAYTFWLPDLQIIFKPKMQMKRLFKCLSKKMKLQILHQKNTKPLILTTNLRLVEKLS